MIRWLWHGPALAVGAVLILCVRGYQWLIRPLLPPSCRFTPGCSEYFILAVHKHGPLIGAAKGTWRICRCNPWGGSGVDWPWPLPASTPPSQLDGADVLLWAVSGRELFHTIPHGADPREPNVLSVAAMAVCRYRNGERYHLFKCDRNWEVVHDWDAGSVQEAQGIAAEHASDGMIQWHSFEKDLASQ